MKSITSTILAILFCTLHLKSQDSGLTISMVDSSYISVELNGTLYDDAVAVMAFHHLRAGTQRLKVYRWLQMGNSVVKQPVYDGYITLEPGRMTNVQINRFNQLVFRNRTPIDYDMQNNLTQNDEPLIQQGFISQPISGFIPHAPVTIQANPAVQIDGFTSVNTTHQQMSNQHLIKQIQTLREIPNERERLQTAKSLISVSTVSSAQLAEMILLFNIEQNRIRLADYGYNYVTDPQNFGIVYQTLRSPRSFHRLDRRIRR